MSRKQPEPKSTEPKSSDPKSATGRFAYEGLQRVIHEKGASASWPRSRPTPTGWASRN